MVPRWPCATVAVATVALVDGSTTVIVPADGMPDRQRGEKVSGPPSRYRPLTSSVGPGLRSGSPSGGPGAADWKHSGCSDTATAVATVPAAGRWADTSLMAFGPWPPALVTVKRQPAVAASF